VGTQFTHCDVVVQTTEASQIARMVQEAALESNLRGDDLVATGAKKVMQTPPLRVKSLADMVTLMGHRAAVSTRPGP